MKPLHLLVVLIVAAAVLGVGVWLRLDTQGSGDLGSRRPAADLPAVATEDDDLPVDRTSPSEPRVEGITEISAAPDPLPEWRRLGALTVDEQEIYLTRLIEEPGWSEEMRETLFPQLANRSLSPVARNNLAIGLLRNGLATARMEEALLVMVDDPAEDPVWAEYSLQFLSVCIERGGVSPRAEEKLRGEFRAGQGSRAATAALQLQRLSGLGVLNLGADFEEAVIAHINWQGTAPILRAIAISIVGSRKIASGADAVRGHAKSGDPAVRRAVYAALGELDQAQDLALIRSGLSDENELVRKAASIALQKLAVE